MFSAEYLFKAIIANILIGSDKGSYNDSLENKNHYVNIYIFAKYKNIKFYITLT